MGGSEFVLQQCRQQEREREWQVAVPADLRYLEGHFDHNPIVAGVVQLECLARRLSIDSWPDLEHLVRVRQLRFRHPVRPGETLRLRLERDGFRVSFRLDREAVLFSSGVLEFEARPS